MPTGLSHTPTHKENGERQEGSWGGLCARFADGPVTVAAERAVRINRGSSSSWGLQRGSEQPSHPLPRLNPMAFGTRGSVQSREMPVTPNGLRIWAQQSMILPHH